MKRVVLKDVAEAAGVSIYTASVALTGRGKIAPERQKTIREIAERMGYQPSLAGRILQGRENRDMGLLILETAEMIRRHVGFSELNLCFMRECRELGIRCHTEWFDPLAHPDTLPGLLKDGLVGGVIVGGEAYGMVGEYFARANAIPHVMVESEGAYSVRFDTEETLRRAVGCLYEAGHRRIALLNGPEAFTTFRAARSGFFDAVTRHGLNTTSECYWSPNSAGWDLVSRVRHGMAALFEQNHDHPTGLIVAGGLLAKSVTTWLLMHGFRIPGDVSLVCFGTADWEAVNFIPALTAVAYDYDAAAHSAVKLLREVMAGSAGETRQIKIQEKLTIRDSVTNCQPQYQGVE